MTEGWSAGAVPAVPTMAPPRIPVEGNGQRRHKDKGAAKAAPLTNQREMPIMRLWKRARYGGRGGSPSQAAFMFS